MASSSLLKGTHVLSNLSLDSSCHRLFESQEGFVTLGTSASRFHNSTSSQLKGKAPVQWGQARIRRVPQRSSLIPTAERTWGQAVGTNVQFMSSIPAQTQLQAEVPLTTELAVGKFAVQGPRQEMEDELVLVTDGPRGFLYAGVFDGHSGHSSSKFLREELYAECVTALEGGSLLESSDTSEAETALANAFLKADKRLVAWLEESATENQSGSTATVVFLREDRLLVAHTGDSRAVMCRAGRAEDITEDHRPFGRTKTALEELKRVKQAGGWVTNGRVCGTLAISRAFGDINLKTQKKELVEKGLQNGYWTNQFAANIDYAGDWVTALPDVRNSELSQDVEFVIIATDGLWDSLESSEAVRFAKRHLEKHGSVQRTCEALVKHALDKNGQDNIAIIMVDFGRRAVEDSASLWTKLWEYIS